MAARMTSVCPRSSGFIGALAEGYWQGTPTGRSALYRRLRVDRGKTNTVDAATASSRVATPEQARVVGDHAAHPDVLEFGDPPRVVDGPGVEVAAGAADRARQPRGHEPPVRHE